MSVCQMPHRNDDTIGCKSSDATPAPAPGPTPFILVLTGTSSHAEAQAIADAAVEQRLAVAVQVIGPVASTYRWEEQVTHAEEWLCLLKTSALLYERVEQTIRSLHSYKLPGILAIPIAAGSAPYLAWFAQALQQDMPSRE
jgi:periplasmic divalent cation tolerance protein